jgi:hypothetical protein
MVKRFSLKAQKSPDINSYEVEALSSCATLKTAVFFDTLLIGPATTEDTADSEVGGESEENI